MLRPLALSLLLVVPVLAAPAHQPRPGSAERKLILEALRKPVQRELKQAVVFKVDHLRVQDGWAFMTGRPQRPDGKKLNYRNTAYRTAIENGAFDDWICALLRKKKGGWSVVRYEIGATDVVWDGWDRQYKAPRSLFPYGR